MKRFIVFVIIGFSILSTSSCVKEDRLIPVGDLLFLDTVKPSFTDARVSCAASGDITISSIFIEYADNDAFKDCLKKKMTKEGEQYSITLDGLSIQTTYYYRYIAVNKVSEYRDKANRSFATSDYVVPQVVTCEATNISGTTATLNGEVTFSCGKDIVEKGFLVGENENDMKEYKSSLQEFSFLVSQLKYDTKYYYRAYAKSEIGRGEGETKYFTTCKSLSFNPLTITEVTATSASLTGGVADSGGVEIEERGFRYKESNFSDIITVNADSKTVITKLKPDTEYSVWCYANTSDGEYDGEPSSFKTLDGKVLINTLSPESVTKNSAKLKGSVSFDGGSAITQRGFCYSTSADPTISNNKIAVIGKAVGEFEYSLWNLPQNTTYYVRAYAINGIGTFYGENISFTTLYDAVQFGELTCSNITASSVSAACSITSNGGSSVTRCGFCYSTSKNPTTDDGVYVVSGSTSSLVGTIKNLNSGTTYYVRAFATNANSTFYSEELSFITVDGIIQFTAPIVSNIAAESAIVTSSVISAGGGIISERGFCYGLTKNPTISDNVAKTSGTVGEYSLTISGLKNKTVYYFRAYATNESGTYYSQEVSATTLDGVATLSTTAATEIMSQSATLNGIITSDGGSNITERGFCYSTSSNPTTSSTKIIIDGTTGSVSKNVTGLNPATKYYVRVYAVNGYGTHYGAQESFTTSDGVVSFSASSTADITVSSFKVSTTISSDGNSTITKRGFCYSTSQNPTTQSNTVEVSGTVGPLSSTVSGLTNNVTYYIRPFAVNAVGTYYGTQVSVKTLSGMADVSTSSITDIKAQSATFNGKVPSANGASIIERGFCYSTTENPTVSSAKVTVTGSTGVMTKTVSSLEPDTKYYVRAFATTSYGTVYGSQLSFTTKTGTVVFTGLASSNILADSAEISVSIDDDGGSNILERGFCYSTNTMPTISNNKVTSSSSSSTYSATISSLQRNTAYYVRAYVKNAIGTYYSGQVSVSTKSGIAVLSGLTVSNVGQTTADASCNVTENGGTDILSRGFCYSTTSGPTTNSSKTAVDGGIGSMSATLSKLVSDSDYYIKAYATTKYETTYSDEIKIHTVAGLATLGAASVCDIQPTSATFGAKLESMGGVLVSTLGFCYGVSINPTTSDNIVTVSSPVSTGYYQINASNLTQFTQYYVRPFAITEYGISYGEVTTFTTTYYPVTFGEISVGNISTVSARIICKINSYGDNGVIEQGVCYSTMSNPDTNQFCYVIDKDAKTNVIDLPALPSGETIFARRYVKNQISTFYGPVIEFETTSVPLGAVAGLFSVSDTKQIFFSQGNLIQNNTSEMTYGYFSTNQYDVLGEDNLVIIQSGSKAFHGIAEKHDMFYPQKTYNGSQLINVGNDAEKWRFATPEEWNYLLTKRKNASVFHNIVTINNIDGLLLLPDDWVRPNYIKSFTEGEIIDLDTWRIMQNCGAVFIPCCGRIAGRYSYSYGYDDLSVEDVGVTGRYCTGSEIKVDGLTSTVQELVLPECKLHDIPDNGNNYSSRQYCAFRLVREYER
ncbi:MAG: hypothetical protein KBS55_00990 [Bacteroidales bacterium]|nr:hypothetical protein [Candidatus Cryptobacteroides aphodequi]